MRKNKLNFAYKYFLRNHKKTCILQKKMKNYEKLKFFLQFAENFKKTYILRIKIEKNASYEKLN